MFRELEIIGYQSHLYNHFEFVPGVNAFVGHSGTGKSSIIRALHWIFTNRPTGDAFRSWDLPEKDNVSVTVVDDTGEYIIREKGPKDNFYMCGNDIGEEVGPFKALRADVPEDVQNTSRIFPVNLQAQRDQWFLIDKSPGHVAKAFNEVANLTIMDDAISEIGSRVRSAGTMIKLLDSKAVEWKDRIDELDWVKTCAEDFKKVKELRKINDKLMDEEENLYTLYNSYFDVQEEIEKFECLAGMEKELKGLKESVEAVKNKRKEEKSLKELSKAYGEMILKLEEYKDIDSAFVALKSLDFALVSYEDMVDEETYLLDIYNVYMEMENNVAVLSEEVKTDADDIKSEFDKHGGCPLCGQEILI